jgi:hypothetical protein
MDREEKAKHAFFIVFTPIVLFFDGLTLIGILRGRFSASPITLGWYALLLLFSLWLYRWRPKVAKAQAARLVLALLGILVGAGVVAVAVGLFLGNLVAAGAIYVTGFVLEMVVSTRLMRKARLLPIRTGTR